MVWEEACRVPSKEMSKLENEVIEIKDLLTLLLIGAGIGKVEEVKWAICNGRYQ